MTGPRANVLRWIWTAPLILAFLTLASLVGALIVEGMWDRIATLVLFGVLAFAVGKGWRSPGLSGKGTRASTESRADRPEAVSDHDDRGNFPESA